MPEQAPSRSRFASWMLLGLIAAVVLLAPVAVFLVNNRPPDIRVHVPKMPKDNGFDYFVRAGEMVSRAGHLGPLSLSTKTPQQWTIPEYHAFLAANSPALAELRVGLGKPYRYPPVLDWTASSASFEHFARFRECARTLVGEGLYYDVSNQPGRAADSMLDCVEFGVTIPRGGTLIAGLVGVTVECIGDRYLEPVILKLPTAELARIAKRLERIQAKRVPYADVIRGEGLASVVNDVRLFSDPSTLKDLANPVKWLADDFAMTSSGGPSSGGGRAKAGRVWENVRFAFANKAAIIRENERYLKAVAMEQRGPYTGNSRVKVPNNPLAQSCMPVFVRARAASCRSEAITTLLQTEVALRRYKLDHGRYPDRLKQLAPAYLRAVPIDPFGRGKPLRYKPLKGGSEYLLYSLGQDMRDDGGAAVSLSSGGGSGDYVAGELW